MSIKVSKQAVRTVQYCSSRTKTHIRIVEFHEMTSTGQYYPLLTISSCAIPREIPVRGRTGQCRTYLTALHHDPSKICSVRASTVECWEVKVAGIQNGPVLARTGPYWHLQPILTRRLRSGCQKNAVTPSTNQYCNF